MSVLLNFLGLFLIQSFFKNSRMRDCKSFFLNLSSMRAMWHPAEKGIQPKKNKNSSHINLIA